MFLTNVVEEIKTHILSSALFCETPAVCVIMRRNTLCADKCFARPGRKQANVSVRRCEFPSAPCLAGGKTYDSSRLGVEIALVPGMLQSLFTSWSGLGLISTPVL